MRSGKRGSIEVITTFRIIIIHNTSGFDYFVFTFGRCALVMKSTATY